MGAVMNDFNTNVNAQIVIDLDLSELSVNGTQLDLLGLSTEIKKFLENLPFLGSQMRVNDVYSPTKDWQIEAQLQYGKPFEPSLDRTENCKCTMLDRMIYSIHCPVHWKKAPHSRACGFQNHDHGTSCHTNCPSCGGRVVRIPEGA